MLERIKTQPVLSDTSFLHKEALKQGKQYFLDCQKFNVLDDLKHLSVDEIKETLDYSAFPYAVCFENWIGDLNFSTGIRNANAFNAKEIFYVGQKRFDKRGCQGTHNYKDIQFLSTIDEFKSLKRKYRIIGIDNISGSTSLKNYTWFKNGNRDLPIMVVFGEEGCGLTTEMQYLCEEIVAINQFGSVRSLNCGTASGIIMHSIVSELAS